MPCCSLCPLQSRAPVFNGQVPPCSGGCDPSGRCFLGYVAVYVVHPSLDRLPTFAAGGSLSGSWSLNGRLWTKVCTCIRSQQSSSVSCELSRCCTSGSCASVVSRSVSPVSSFSPVSVVGVGGSRVGPWGWCFTGWGGRWACMLSLRF